MKEVSSQIISLVESLRDKQQDRLTITSHLADKIHKVQILLEENSILEAKKIIADALQECEELIRIV